MPFPLCRQLPGFSVIKVKRKDVGALLLAYPTSGLSHCLDQDKQLEIAHAVRYCNGRPSLQITVQGGWTAYNTPKVDAPVA